MIQFWFFTGRQNGIEYCSASRLHFCSRDAKDRNRNYDHNINNHCYRRKVQGCRPRNYAWDVYERIRGWRRSVKTFCIFLLVFRLSFIRCVSCFRRLSDSQVSFLLVSYWLMICCSQSVVRKNDLTSDSLINRNAPFMSFLRVWFLVRYLQLVFHKLKLAEYVNEDFMQKIGNWMKFWGKNWYKF